LQPITDTWTVPALLLVAALYASVGQAGATGYIAVLGLAGTDPVPMKLAALVLNLLVAGIGSFQFWRVGRLAWRDVYPFALLGMPFSMLGGATTLPGTFYFPIVGLLLVIAAALTMRRGAPQAALQDTTKAAVPFLPALLVGAMIGFVSGTTGTGGGVFLAPVILAMRWAPIRRVAAVTAVYNLMNSAAALLGSHAQWSQMPESIGWWAAAVTVGGVIGATIGSRLLPDHVMRVVLALLLFASGLKLMFA
jgi:uncharacterized membrane protein YfcA